jgi:uncharacterized protein (DUF952 family)
MVQLSIGSLSESLHFPMRIMDARVKPAHDKIIANVEEHTSMPTIYKILSASEWRDAERAGAFSGSAVDRRDGFIHFSTAEQVIATAQKHFAGQRDLVLVSVDAAALGDRLRWEPSRGGALFPHLYGAMEHGAVLRVEPLPLDAQGRHVFPRLLS